jgi:hypothetical protein
MSSILPLSLLAGVACIVILRFFYTCPFRERHQHSNSGRSRSQWWQWIECMSLLGKIGATDIETLAKKSQFRVFPASHSPGVLNKMLDEMAGSLLFQ